MPILKLVIPDEEFAKLEGEGDLPLFVALAAHGQKKILHVHIRYRKFYDLLYPAAGAEDRRRGDKHPLLIEGAWLESE